MSFCVFVKKVKKKLEEKSIRGVYDQGFPNLSDFDQSKRTMTTLQNWDMSQWKHQHARHVMLPFRRSALISVTLAILLFGRTSQFHIPTRSPITYDSVVFQLLVHVHPLEFGSHFFP